MLWNAKLYSAARAVVYLKAFHKVDLNIGKIGERLLGPPLPPVHSLSQNLFRNAKKCRHIFHSFNLHTDAKSRAAHIFGRFWNLCSLSFSIQIGRPWWMDPNARAMAKKLRRFVSDLWFIQNTWYNIFSWTWTKRRRMKIYISRFHLWYSSWLID